MINSAWAWMIGTATEGQYPNLFSDTVRRKPLPYSPDTVTSPAPRNGNGYLAVKNGESSHTLGTLSGYRVLPTPPATPSKDSDLVLTSEALEITTVPEEKTSMPVPPGAFPLTPTKSNDDADLVRSISVKLMDNENHATVADPEASKADTILRAAESHLMLNTNQTLQKFALSPTTRTKSNLSVATDEGPTVRRVSAASENASLRSRWPFRRNKVDKYSNEDIRRLMGNTLGDASI